MEVYSKEAVGIYVATVCNYIFGVMHIRAQLCVLCRVYRNAIPKAEIHANHKSSFKLARTQLL